MTPSSLVTPVSFLLTACIAAPGTAPVAAPVLPVVDQPECMTQLAFAWESAPHAIVWAWLAIAIVAVAAIPAGRASHARWAWRLALGGALACAVLLPLGRRAIDLRRFEQTVEIVSVPQTGTVPAGLRSFPEVRRTQCVRAAPSGADRNPECRPAREGDPRRCHLGPFLIDEAVPGDFEEALPRWILMTGGHERVSGGTWGPTEPGSDRVSLLNDVIGHRLVLLDEWAPYVPSHGYAVTLPTDIVRRSIRTRFPVPVWWASAAHRAFWFALAGDVLALGTLVRVRRSRTRRSPAGWTSGTLDADGLIHGVHPTALRAPPRLRAGTVLVRVPPTSASSYRHGAALAPADIVVVHADDTEHHVRVTRLSALALVTAAAATTPIAALWVLADALLP